MQLTSLFPVLDNLHAKHGDAGLASIYGAGQVNSPKLLLMFMNPTSRNIASTLSWTGLRAPWLGTRHVWRLLSRLGLFDDAALLARIEELRPHEWTQNLCDQLYTSVAKQSLYITNLAKCTQVDARPLSDSVFKDYLPSSLDEILQVNPTKIISFGNQVSSILQGKAISVSQYTHKESEELTISGKVFQVYPCYYPVGQGGRNIDKATNRIGNILAC